MNQFSRKQAQNACVQLLKTSVLGLKVPKCEIFDPFFYTNKSYMDRWLEDWRKKNFVSKTTADIRHFVFF
jgi:hypothetical protein